MKIPKISINLIFILTIFMIIPPIILFVVLFTVTSFSVTTAIPIPLNDLSVEFGIIPLVQNYTIWETAFNWLYFIGLIIWTASGCMFVVSHQFEEQFENKAYILGISGIIFTNLALVADIIIYNMSYLTLFPAGLSLILGLLGAIIGIYIKTGD